MVSAGHKLESSTDAEASSLPDIGYTALEERYNALKVIHSVLAGCACTLVSVGWLEP